MRKLKGLLFDVDGTLADTERDGHRVAFNLAFAEAGLDWRWDIATYGKLLEVTGGKERIRHFIERFQPRLGDQDDPEPFIRQLHGNKTRYYLSLLKTGSIPLRPGVTRLLDEARAAGLKLGIATTTTPESVTTLLRANLGPNSPDWFDVIAAGDIVSAKKPAPDIYQYALRAMGLTAEECLALEDSDNGFLAASRAGLRAVITVNGYTRLQSFDGAMLVVDQLGEPDAPCRVLAGDAAGWELVDVNLIRRLFEGRPRDE